MARPKPTGWKARATWHGLSSPCRGGRRRAEGWPTEHTEEFLTGGNGVIGGRIAEGVWPAPNPRAGKPVPRGMGFPAHVGATADRAGRMAEGWPPRGAKDAKNSDHTGA